VDFDVADRQSDQVFCLCQTLENNEYKMGQLVSEVWYDILAEFGVFAQPASLMKL
jgi:hypothetical protein